MSIRSLTVTTFLAFSLIIILSADLRAEYDKNKDYHSSQMLINYGLNMIADGSSIIMATEMDMKTTITQEPVDYGNEMIALGKSFVEMALKGPHMVEKHVQKKVEVQNFEKSDGGFTGLVTLNLLEKVLGKKQSEVVELHKQG